MRDTPFFIRKTKRAGVNFDIGNVSGELEVKDKAQYLHDGLMIKHVHLVTGTPSFYIQHYHGTVIMLGVWARAVLVGPLPQTSFDKAQKDE